MEARRKERKKLKTEDWRVNRRKGNKETMSEHDCREGNEVTSEGRKKREKSDDGLFEPLSVCVCLSLCVFVCLCCFCVFVCMNVYVLSPQPPQSERRGANVAASVREDWPLRRLLHQHQVGARTAAVMNPHKSFKS